MPLCEIPLTKALIPGAYERNTLTHRPIGSMGGPAFGSTDVPIGPGPLSAATIADREMEGGGDVSQRRRRIVAEPAGRAVPDRQHHASRSTGVYAWIQPWWRLARR